MSLAISEIELFKALKLKLGEAEKLVMYVKSKVETTVEERSTTLATKEDIKDFELNVERKFAEIKVDLIKWMFALYISMMLMILGLYFKDLLLSS